MAPALEPTLALVSAVPLTLLGLWLLVLRPWRATQVSFGLFATLWGLQVVGANLGFVLDDAALFETGFLASLALLPPASLFLAQFAAGTHGGRWAWLLPAGVGVVAGGAVLVLLADPELVLASVQARPDGGIGAVSLGPAAFPLFFIPFFGVFYLALLLVYRRYRSALPGSPRHRLRGMVAALALYTSYQTVTNGFIFVGAPAGQGTAAQLSALAGQGLFLAGGLLLVGMVAHLALRPPPPEGRDPLLIAAFLVPAGVALVTELVATEARSWGLWRLAMVAVLVHVIARYRLFDLDLRLKRWAAPSLAGLLLGLGAVATLALTLDGQGVTWSLAPLAASTVGAGVLVASRETVGQAFFPAASQDPAYLQQRKLEVYRAALERVAPTGGQPTGTDDPMLDRLRESLGISTAEHQALAAQLAELGHPAPEAQATPQAAVRTGALLAGRYRVERLLGEGGYGRAFLAYDQEEDRAVVLKVVGTAVLGGRAATRLVHEAEVLTGLDHPHIVEVHGVLEGPHEVVLVLEHAAGGSLEGLLSRRGRLGLSQAVELVDQVLEGLAAAHEAGVVHRDVKPGNVLLDGDGRVKLADFGIARGPDTAATLATAGPVGTLLYMAPEQVRGQEADERADLYAVGVLLHELVTGRLPLETTGRDDFQLRRAILEEAPRLRVDDQPAWLHDLLERALAKDPSQRFPDAAAMRAALGGRPVVTQFRA